MKREAIIMAMPVRVTICDETATEEDIEQVFAYLRQVDEQFSTYKRESEIERINRGLLSIVNASAEMQKVLKLCEETKQQTKGYFDSNIHGRLDPSGLVKGYAILRSANMLAKQYQNFSVEIAGDAEVRGVNEKGEKWKIGIENPFNRAEIVRVIGLSNQGVATSGTYIRREHIYDPLQKKTAVEIASITVIGPNVYEADRFATAAFAMGHKGIQFIESLPGFEAYMIGHDKKAQMTSGFGTFVL